MALFDRHPKVRLLGPPTLAPGEQVALRVEVDCRRALAVDAIDLALRGQERWHRSPGTLVHAEERALGPLLTRLTGPTTLPVGTSTFPVRLELPTSWPPSYASRDTRVAYEAKVEVDIPWWPDASRTFALQVGHAPGESEGKAVIVSTAPAGPSGNEPHVECSLTSDVTVVGGKFEAAVSLQNVAWNRYRGLEVSLVGMERRVGPRRDEPPACVFRHVTRLDVGAPVEGQRVRFTVPVPSSAAPTFTSNLWELAWQIEIVAPCRWGAGARLVVPVQIAPANWTLSRPAERPAPRVGRERMSAAWSAVAARHGLVHEADDRLTAAIGDVGLLVRTEHRGTAGLFVVVDLAFPSLGLRLRGRPARALRRLLGGGVMLDSTAGPVRVEGREPAQVQAFVEPLRSILARAPRVHLDDAEVRIERRGGGHDEAKLDDIAALAVELARALPEARDAIPPPAVMASSLPAWEDLGRELDGPIETARMACVGRHAGRTARVTTEWDERGRADHTLVELAAEPPLEEQQRMRFVSGQGWTPPLETLPPRARVLLVRAEARLLGASLTREWLSLALPAPLLDPAPEVRARLALLAELSRELTAVRSGPYR